MEHDVEKWVLASNYPVELRPRIKIDLQANVQNFGFGLTITTLRENNQVNKVVALQGPLQVNYNHSTYSVPIICILPLRYPYSTPIVYVLKPQGTNLQVSSHLNAEGLVNHPVLSQWNHKSSLSNALRQIAQTFESCFPIVSGPASSYVPPPVQPVVRSESLYPDLAQKRRQIRLDKKNPMHSVYFDLEEKERILETSILTTCLYLEGSPDDPARIIIDLKKKYYELFLMGRKKDKSILILNKLG